MVFHFNNLIQKLTKAIPQSRAMYLIYRSTAVSFKLATLSDRNAFIKFQEILRNLISDKNLYGVEVMIYR